MAIGPVALVRARRSTVMDPSEELLRYLYGPPCAQIRGGEALAEASAVLELDGALYATAKRRGHLEALPTEIVERMRRIHTENAAHNLELLRCAVEIEDAMLARGARMRFLKGAFLLRSGVIESLGTRYMQDLDVLIDESGREAMDRALVDLGYSRMAGATPKHLPAYARGTVTIEPHEFAFWGRDGHRFGVDDHDASTGLAFTAVHLAHHLYVSSIWEPPLGAKTLADFSALLEPLTGETLRRARELARRASVARELDDLLETARRLRAGEPLGASGERVFSTLRVPDELERLRRVFAFYWRTTVLAPAWFRAALLSSIAFPDRATMEARYGLRPGSPWVYAAYAARPVKLGAAAIEWLLVGLGNRKKKT